ncbi:MAG: hypothetical protein QNJ41_24530 [Xenococcaceae cyanobacterium MO_188.B32]|nr:hypothetical protein [Xenococcaceae cyanobacterium MO_188.B32]
MSKIKNERASGIPRWQSDRMRRILAEQWQEVCKAVETRVQNSRVLRSAQGKR